MGAMQQASQHWQRINEIPFPGEPKITVRAKTQTVVDGVLRYMGELWEMPTREALGLIGWTNEIEQVIDRKRPLDWMQSAPGPHESFDMPGDSAAMGSREGRVRQRGGEPGNEQHRQLKGAEYATALQPQAYDDYRVPGEAGMDRHVTGQAWRTGADGPTRGTPPQPITESGGPPHPPGQGRPPGMFPPGRPPGFTPPRPPGREERRDDRDDRREARHERRDERGDREAHHERREDRYDRRHEARDDRRESRHERRDERGDRDREGRRRHKG